MILCLLSIGGHTVGPTELKFGIEGPHLPWGVLWLHVDLVHLSLKMQNVQYDITVPSGQNVRQNLMSKIFKIKMSPYHSMQMSIQC